MMFAHTTREKTNKGTHTALHTQLSPQKHPSPLLLLLHLLIGLPQASIPQSASFYWLNGFFSAFIYLLLLLFYYY